MSKSVKKSAKTVKEAIDLALAELRLTEDDVTIEIIEEGESLFIFIIIEIQCF